MFCFYARRCFLAILIGGKNMNPVNSVVSHSPLTQNDITRMPRSAADVAVAPQAAGTDTYQPTTEKKSGTFGKLLLGLAVAAAAIPTPISALITGDIFFSPVENSALSFGVAAIGV